jgi:hypothetical protein
MKSWNDLTPEQQSAIRNPGTGEDMGGWNGYPCVNAEEADALRNGKPYPLTGFDLERLTYVYDMGFAGNPDTDPLVVKCLAKGFIVENPKYVAELAANQARIAKLKAQYGDGDYSIGVGLSNNRWILTDAGKAFVRKLTE